MTKKHSKAAQDEVKKEMHRYKKGTAHSGLQNKKVTSKEQAVAIGLSKAGKKGTKVPKKPSAKKLTTKKSTTKKPMKKSIKKTSKKSTKK